MPEDLNSPRRLTRIYSSHPVFSPDGEAVAFSVSINFLSDIYIRQIRPYRFRRLTDGPGMKYGAVFSPNGAQIAYVVDPIGDSEETNIFIINSDGTGEGRRTGTGKDRSPTFSPDGKCIAFVRRTEIALMNADGTEQRLLTNTWDGTMPRRGPAPRSHSPIFSPNGEKIAFSSSANAMGRFEIYSMNRDGSGQKRLTETDGSCGSPAYSPDGQQIAFSCHVYGTQGTQIHIMNADGGGRRTLPNTLDVDDKAHFAPNGRSITFSRRRDKKYADIWVIDTGNGDADRLTNNNSMACQPQFSPDGKHITYVAYEEGGSNVYFLPLTGYNRAEGE